MSRNWKLISIVFLYALLNYSSAASANEWVNWKYSKFMISNKILNYKTDTINVYKNRIYSKNRNLYAKIYNDSIYLWKFYNENMEEFYQMGEAGNPDSFKFDRRLYDYDDTRIYNDYYISWVDITIPKYRLFRFDSTLKEITNVTSNSDFFNDKYVRNDSLFEYSYQESPKAKFEYFTKNLRISAGSPKDKYSKIYYDGILTDSLQNTISHIIRDSVFIYWHYASDILSSKGDTVFGITILPEHIENYQESTINSFELFMIVNGKKNTITTTDTVRNYLNALRNDSLFSNKKTEYGVFSFGLKDVIDNTIIIENRHEECFLYYDYINKKFFDPVIKIIDD